MENIFHLKQDIHLKTNTTANNNNKKLNDKIIFTLGGPECHTSLYGKLLSCCAM